MIALPGTDAAVTAALAGAAAGGGFALLSQIVGKTWDAVAARTSRTRQTNGLLATTLAEVMCNLKALAILVDELESLTKSDDFPGWEPVARHRLRTWLTTSGIRDQEWHRFASSDVASEFSPDARVLLSECYDQVHVMAAKMACEVDSPIAIYKPAFGYYRDVANESIQYGFAFALSLAAHTRRLRKSAIWLQMIRTLAWYGASGRRFQGVNWERKSSRQLRKQITRVCRYFSGQGEGLANDCQVALAVLGLGPEPIENQTG